MNDAQLTAVVGFVSSIIGAACAVAGGLISTRVAARASSKSLIQAEKREKLERVAKLTSELQTYIEKAVSQLTKKDSDSFQEGNPAPELLVLIHIHFPTFSDIAQKISEAETVYITNMIALSTALHRTPRIQAEVDEIQKTCRKELEIIMVGQAELTGKLQEVAKELYQT